jgi:hypothetical protein
MEKNDYELELITIFKMIDQNLHRLIFQIMCDYMIMIKLQNMLISQMNV